MKKLVLALSAVAAFSAPALAADMAAKAPMMRAAPVAYAPSWTGCYVGGGGGYGGRPRQEGPREMTKVKCSDCGAETEVPFKPTEGRPVYCRECYQKHKPARNDRF